MNAATTVPGLDGRRPIDITTTGRQTGEARRIEIAIHNIDGRLFISGMPSPRTRSWIYNLMADPRMTIHVKNRLHRTIHLRSVKTTVRAAARGCSGTNLVVAAYRGRLRIRPRGWSRVIVSVRMRLDSPNACQGKVFPLTFKGQASA